MVSSAFVAVMPLCSVNVQHFSNRHNLQSFRCASSFIQNRSLRVWTPHHVQSGPVLRKSAQKIRMVLSDVEQNSLTVLVVGSGGREHALADSLSKSPYLSKLLAAPGNAGMASVCECVPSVSAEDVDAIVELAKSREVSLVVVGPEAALVGGVVDRLTEAGILAFGPTAAAAELEGSKVFSKCFLERHGIPTAEFAAFADVEPAQFYARELGEPLVIKAGGLAAGKGVVLTDSLDEALASIEDMIHHGRFGPAGKEVVVERRLEGEEVSFFAVVDGETALPLASAQDHKAAFDGDTGPNTGGMGAYSPAPVCDETMVDDIMSRVIRPTIAGMREDGVPFSGLLYCGLMVNPETRDFSVLEFNVRFGDPECQVLCARLKSDLLELLYRAASRRLAEDEFNLEWNADPALVVVMASNGYPGSYEKGSVIRRVDDANAIDGVVVYHAGTARSDSGDLIANGGRVLGVTASASSIEEAQRKAYSAVDTIDWPEGFCRRDIGWRAVDRKQGSAISGSSR